MPDFGSVLSYGFFAGGNITIQETLWVNGTARCASGISGTSYANSDAVFYGPGVYLARALLAIAGENLNKKLKDTTPILTPNKVSRNVWPCPNPNEGLLKFCKNFSSNETYHLENSNMLGPRVVD